MKKILSLVLTAAFLAFCITPVLNTKGSQAMCATYKQVRVSVIVLKTQSEALKVKSMLDKGGNFAALARKYSIVETSKKGGDCVFITKADIEQQYPEFSELAQTAQIGDISQPIKTQDGWTIAKLISRI